MGHEVCRRIGASPLRYSCHAGFACGVHGVDEVSEREVVCIGVSEVVVIG